MKQMYVWNYADGLTSNYHDGGGCLVIADSLELARKLLEDYKILKSSSVFTEKSDLSISVEYSEDLVMIFPDAGCC